MGRERQRETDREREREGGREGERDRRRPSRPGTSAEAARRRIGFVSELNCLIDFYEKMTEKRRSVCVCVHLRADQTRLCRHAAQQRLEVAHHLEGREGDRERQRERERARESEGEREGGREGGRVGERAGGGRGGERKGSDTLMVYI